MPVSLAFYKAPGTAFDGAVRYVTDSPYSHVELVIDGVFWSSSPRDGGVRRKLVPLDHAKWDFIHFPSGPETDALGEAARLWMLAHEGEGYDWLGVGRFVIPALPEFERRWFCSEAVAAAMAMPNPADWSPGRIAAYFAMFYPLDSGGVPA